MSRIAAFLHTLIMTVDHKKQPSGGYLLGAVCALRRSFSDPKALCVLIRRMPQPGSPVTGMTLMERRSSRVHRMLTEISVADRGRTTGKILGTPCRFVPARIDTSLSQLGRPCRRCMRDETSRGAASNPFHGRHDGNRLALLGPSDYGSGQKRGSPRVFHVLTSTSRI